MMNRKSHILLLGAVSFLTVVGLVMILSTCIFSAHADSADGYREAKKQAVWLLVGGGACWWAALTDYRFWKKNVWWIFGGVTFLLALCFLPGFGMKINGEQRWIGVGSFQIQPSEFSKIAVVVFLSYWYSRYPGCGKNVLHGFGIPLVVAGSMIALVLFEVDIGTTIVLTSTTFLLLFVGGVNWKYLAGLAAAGVAGFLGMLSYAPDRMSRIMAFLDPEKHKLDAGFQQWISLMALGSGGLTGRGIGEGRLKMLYMPFAQTDFIFPMIGEEMGLICTAAIMLAFVAIVISGYAIAFEAPDRFGTFLGMGMATFLAMQAFLNIGVTTAFLPNTGLPLPFISYGGSSLMSGMLAVGILINIYRQGHPAEDRSLDWTMNERITPRV